MRVTSEARPAGGGRTYSVTIEDHDMLDIEGFQGLRYPERYRKMSDRADVLLVTLLFRRGEISEEFLTQRVREITQSRPA